MSNTKKPAFNADAAEEYFSDLLVYYRNTANDIFRRDNDGRHASEHIYSAEYQKYVGMQIAMREVLEYFSKYDLCEWITEIPTDRLRELVESDRDGRCVVLPKDGMVYYIEEAAGEKWVANKPIQQITVKCGWGVASIEFSLFDAGKYFTREAAKAALKGRYQNENF